MLSKRKNPWKKRNKYIVLLLAPFVALYVIFGLFPIVYSFAISLTDWTFGKEIHFVGLQNYIELFTIDPYFWKSVGNTLILMLLYIPASLIVALLLANAIFYKGTRFKRFFQVAFFLPNVTTAVAIGLMFALIFDWQTGILNNLLIQLGVVDSGINWLGEPGTARFVTGLMLFWAYFGYCTVFYLSGLAGISEDIYEAARIDGASRRKMLIHITIPMLRPITSFLLLTSFISGTRVMEEPMLLLNGWATAGHAVGGPDRSCLTFVWYLYDVAFGNGTNLQYGKGSAIGYAAFILVLLVVVICKKGQKIMQKRKGEWEE